MHMHSTKHSIRIVLPWLIAGLSAAVFIFFSTALIITQMSTDAEAVKTVERSVQSFLPRDPLTSRIMLALAMVPSEKREVPLVAAMIENHEDARPHQAGLREAVVVFEMIVEGDISRFMALYRSDRLPDLIGPIRSLRPHFISAVRGYNPLLLHAGGSQFAYDALARLPDLPNHDGIRYDGETYERDKSIEPPHNLFMRKAPLLSVLEQSQNKLFPVHFPLYPTRRRSPKGGESARKVTLDFDSEEHNAVFTYKPLHGLYVRSTFNARRQAQPKTIVVLQTLVDGFNQKGYIPWTQTFGDGKMLLFRNGKKFEGTWEREKGEPFRFLDGEGNVLPVARGQVWITLLPMLSMASWE